MCWNGLLFLPSQVTVGAVFSPWIGDLQQQALCTRDSAHRSVLTTVSLLLFSFCFSDPGSSAGGKVRLQVRKPKKVIFFFFWSAYPRWFIRMSLIHISFLFCLRNRVADGLICFPLCFTAQEFYKSRKHHSYFSHSLLLFHWNESEAIAIRSECWSPRA